MKNKQICIGKITAPHGIKGEVKIKAFLDNPNDLTKFKKITNEKGTIFEIENIRGQKNDVVISKIKGCDDRNSSETLRNIELFVDRNELPETETGQYYYNDLIGLKVFENEEEIGVVKNVYNFGAGDILEIALENGKDIDIPFVDEFVKNVDLKNSKVSVIKPEYIE